jgi:hypothetical protein
VNAEARPHIAATVVQWRRAAGPPMVHGSTMTRVGLVGSRALGSVAAWGSVAASLDSEVAALVSGGVLR